MVPLTEKAGRSLNAAQAHRESIPLIVGLNFQFAFTQREAALASIGGPEASTSTILPFLTVIRTLTSPADASAMPSTDTAGWDFEVRDCCVDRQYRSHLARLTLLSRTQNCRSGWDVPYRSIYSAASGGTPAPAWLPEYSAALDWVRIPE